MMEWYLLALSRYGQTSGRSRRKEYWMFVLFNIIFSFVLGFIEGYLGLASFDDAWGPLTGLYALAVLLPGIAVSVRRLHDTGRSGWWLLLAFVPLVNFYLIYLMATDGEAGQNEYGPNPKTTPAYA